MDFDFFLSSVYHIFAGISISVRRCEQKNALTNAGYRAIMKLKQKNRKVKEEDPL